MSMRVITGVVVGYLTNALLIAGTEQLLSRFISPGNYYAADIATQGIIQVGCGYLCSRIARPRRLTAIAVLIVVGLVIGWASVVASWRTEPHWYAITLLGIYGPCVWI